MKCPLLAIGYLSLGDQGVNQKCECLKEGCAWWEPVSRSCVLLAVYQELRLLVGAAGLAANRLSPAKE